MSVLQYENGIQEQFHPEEINIIKYDIDVDNFETVEQLYPECFI